MSSDILINFDIQLKQDFEDAYDSKNYKEMFNIGKTYCHLSTVNKEKQDYFLKNAKECFEFLKDIEEEEIIELKSTMYYIYKQACDGIYNYEESPLKIQNDNEMTDEYIYCSNKEIFHRYIETFDKIKNKNNILKELLDYYEDNYDEFTEDESSKIFNWFENKMNDNIIVKYYIGHFYLDGIVVTKDKEKGIKLIKETENVEEKDHHNFSENLILLGNWYKDGSNVIKDINKAGKLYTKALSFSNKYDDSADKLVELINDYDWGDKDQYNNLLQILNNNISEEKVVNEEYNLLKELINDKIN
jgi:hypothetical protein